MSMDVNPMMADMVGAALGDTIRQALDTALVPYRAHIEALTAQVQKLTAEQATLNRTIATARAGGGLVGRLLGGS